MNNETNNKFIQNLITKYSKLKMNKQNRTKLQNELIKNNLQHLYTEINTQINQKKVEYQQNDNMQFKEYNSGQIINKNYKKIENNIKENMTNKSYKNNENNDDDLCNNIDNEKVMYKYSENTVKKNEDHIKERFADFNESNDSENSFSTSADVLSFSRRGDGFSSLELIKQRELDDTVEQYLLQKELMVLERQILETFKFLIEDLFNEETLKYDREITTLLKQMYKEGLEQGMKGEFNVYQLESILRQINQSDPTSKLKAVIDIYQKFKGEQSGNTVNILNQAGEIKVGGATHKVFNDLEQTNFIDMIETMENDLSEKKDGN